jgi:hypothetical protein
VLILCAGGLRKRGVYASMTLGACVGCPAIKNDSGAIVSADSYIDFLLARSLLQRKGWRVTRPGSAKREDLI